MPSSTRSTRRVPASGRRRPSPSSNQTLADLAQTGMREAALQAGDVAPRLTLPDQEGRRVPSPALLAKGPFVLVCDRGMW